MYIVYTLDDYVLCTQRRARASVLLTAQSEHAHTPTTTARCYTSALHHDHEDGHYYTYYYTVPNTTLRSTYYETAAATTARDGGAHSLYTRARSRIEQSVLFTHTHTRTHATYTRAARTVTTHAKNGVRGAAFNYYELCFTTRAGPRTNGGGGDIFLWDAADTI